MMKSTPSRSWAPLIALLNVPGLLAQPAATATATESATATSETPSCTASLITTLCDYADPFRAIASSEEGEKYCWGYCNENQPCDFVIFAAGNPYLGTGTCWVYPGESFDESKGETEGCSNQWLSVYAKPECEAPTTTASYSCSATASPSPVASVCGYPPPTEDCFYDCKASSGAPHCLSLCAESESCNYAVYNPLGETNSPYEPGNCWTYSEGKYNEDDAGSCGSDGPEQYVYKNDCPKPPKPSTSSRSASTATESDGDSPTSAANRSEAGDEDDNSPTADADRSEAGDDEDEEDAASAPAALSLSALMAAGLAMLL